MKRFVFGTKKNTPTKAAQLTEDPPAASSNPPRLFKQTSGATIGESGILKKIVRIKRAEDILFRIADLEGLKCSWIGDKATMEELEKVLKVSETKVIRGKGQVLISAGTPTDTMYLIKDGCVDVLDVSDPNAKKSRHILGPGEWRSIFPISS